MTAASRTPRYAVITTHNRPDELLRITRALASQADHVIIIDNASSPPARCHASGRAVHTLIHDSEQPPNLYRLWNRGLATAAEFAASAGVTEWDVALFNDDANVPDGWYDCVATALRSGPFAAASTMSYQPTRGQHVKTQPDRDLFARMCPWAFVTRGELNLRADEDFRWWWGDTDFDWRCRQSGGVVITDGPVVPNTLANTTTVGVLAEQAGRDGETFTRKWGFRPW